MKHMTRQAALACTLAVLAFFVLFAPAPLGAVVLDRIVAVVNNEAITWLELYDAMKVELDHRMKGMGEQERKELLAANEADFLEAIIINRIQVQEARKNNISVSASDLDNAIMSIRTKYGLDEQGFRDAIASTGSTWEGYRKNLKDQILIRKLVDREVRSKLAASDASTEGQGGVRYHLRQVYIKAGPDREREELEGMVQAVYDALNEGRSFESVAAFMSEGPGAASGGDLGLIEGSSLSDGLRDAVAGLSPGQVADPVWTSRGIHIVKLEDRVSAAEESMQKDFQRLYAEWLKHLRGSAYVDIRL